MAATTSSELLPYRLNATFTNPGEKRGKEKQEKRRGKRGKEKGRKQGGNNSKSHCKLMVRSIGYSGILGSQERSIGYSGVWAGRGEHRGGVLP